MTLEANSLPPSRRLTALWLLALIVVGAAFYLTVGKVLSLWWFGDDPIQFAAVRSTANPIRFFIDFDLAKSFGSGHGVVPMQMLDYWIDTRLPGGLPFMAYVHNLLTTLAALVGIFFVIRCVTDDLRLAFVGGLAWLVMPASFATNEYLSIRQYTEGLAFACVVFCLTYPSRRITPISAVVVALAALAAMLSKEIYAGMVPALLIAFGIVRRNRGMVISAFVLGLFYAVYRIAAVGGSMHYVVPMPNLRQYVHYLAVMPFTFHETLLGYPVFVATLWATYRYYRTSGEGARRDFWIFAGLLAATMFMLIPVAVPSLINYKIAAGWLRTAYLPSTILLVWIALLAKRLAPGKVSVAMMAILALSFVPGLIRCLRWRDENMTKQEVEGKFFLSKPRRLLYTDEADTWYYDGLRNWYSDPDAVILLKERREDDKDRQKLLTYGTVWTYRNGRMQPDPEVTEMYRRRLLTPSSQVPSRMSR